MSDTQLDKEKEEYRIILAYIADLIRQNGILPGRICLNSFSTGYKGGVRLWTPNGKFDIVPRFKPAPGVKINFHRLSYDPYPAKYQCFDHEISNPNFEDEFNKWINWVKLN